MTMPEAVRRQMDEANQLIQQNAQSANPAPEGNTDDGNPAPSEPQQQPQTLEQPGTPAPQAPTPAGQDFEQLYRAEAQRYKVLQGKYQAEVPRLQGEVKQLQAQLQTRQEPQADPRVPQLEQEIATLKQQLADKPAAPVEVDTSLLDEARETYGDEYAKPIEAVMNQNAQLAQQLQQATATIQQLQQTSQQSQKDQQASLFNTRTQELTALLAKQGIDFAQQNDDPLFGQWLDQSDPMAGYKRRDLLNQAFSQGDVQRAANWFLAYRQETPNHQPDFSEQARIEQPQAQAPQPTGASVWTPQQAQAFFNDKALGRLRNPDGSPMSPEQAAQMEREMLASLAGQ